MDIRIKYTCIINIYTLSYTYKHAYKIVHYRRYSCDHAHYQRSDIQDNVTMQLWNSESNVRAEDLCFTILGLCSYGSVLYTTNKNIKMQIKRKI